MRKIKFRAWDKIGGFMLGVGEIDFENNTFRPYCCPKLSIKLQDAILMQNTGLFDKNDKDIWEDDIVFRHHAGYDKNGFRYWGVFWDERNAGYKINARCGFRVKLTNKISKQLEVVGNAHMNPELLEQQ